MAYRAVYGILFAICLGIGTAQAHHDHFAEQARDFDFNNVTQGQELGCLALNIYHEGRGESAKGQSAIAAVTMNRVASKHYPDSICEVVWQRKHSERA